MTNQGSKHSEMSMRKTQLMFPLPLTRHWWQPYYCGVWTTEMPICMDFPAVQAYFWLASHTRTDHLINAWICLQSPCAGAHHVQTGCAECSHIERYVTVRRHICVHLRQSPVCRNDVACTSLIVCSCRSSQPSVYNWWSRVSCGQCFGTVYWLMSPQFLPSTFSVAASKHI